MSYITKPTSNLFSKKEQHKPTRDGFGDALVAAGKKNKNIVALCADLTESTRMQQFKNTFPNRFVEVGVAEQNMVGLAAGMAQYGKIPFCASYATFSPGRSWDQCRVSVAYPKNNVKIVGAHAGISVGPDGATHQALEDIAIMRALPNMTIFSPCDYHQAYSATLTAAKFKGPIYLRLTREKTPIITTPQTPFKLGKAQIMRKGTDATIIATGPILYEALLAAEILAGNKKALNTLLQRYPSITTNFDKTTYSFTPESIQKLIQSTTPKNIEVINIHTIKPLDEKAVITSAKKTNLVCTVEEHQIHGGLRSTIAETLSLHYPTKILPIGMPDSFGESGKPMELYEKYEMTAPHIIQTLIPHFT